MGQGGAAAKNVGERHTGKPLCTCATANLRRVRPLTLVALAALQLPLAAAVRSPDTSVVARYRPLRKHPALFDASAGWTQWLDPSLMSALAELQATGNTTRLLSLLRVEASGHSQAYSLPFVSEAFCDLFLEELDHYHTTGLPISRPNSMNNYGIIVNDIGMKPVLTWLQRTVLHPLAELLYPAQARGGFTDHHSFMVQYRSDQDQGLDMHTDDSDVTVNICLGRNFTGATLTVCGDNHMPDHRQYHATYHHVRGRALIHLGSRRHGADDILAGERNNLIVWNHNQKYRDSTENVNNLPFYPEQAPPDPRCLSYTHDRDFGGFLDYPPGKAEFRSKGWCPPEKACYAQMDRVFSNIDYGLKTDFTLKGWDLKSEL